ncbi:MAG: hypothetical protein HZA68_00040 [Rhodovulum sp.]|nr:hypothetical protein [Rhodovulum sp.]
MTSEKFDPCGALADASRRRPCGTEEPGLSLVRFRADDHAEEDHMGRYFLLWMLGIPIPVLALIWLFGGLN